MKHSTSRSLVPGLALALSVINIALFVIGIRWAHEAISELASKSGDESVLGAAEKVDQAYGAVVNILHVAVWSACLLGGIVLLAVTARQWKKATHVEEITKICSYTGNVARSNRRERRRHKKRANQSSSKKLPDNT